METKRGRPAKYGEKMKDYRLRLAKHHAETLRKAGEGNMSAGARTLADEWEDREMKKSEGMTLIELLVVVGICAILAALILTQICKAREPAHWRTMEERSRQKYIGMLSEDPMNVPISKTLGTCKVTGKGITYYWGPQEGFTPIRWDRISPDAFYGK